MTASLDALLRAERRSQRAMLRRAALCALLVGWASVALLGLSGWFITAAAAAGATGPLAAQAFNYMLPSAAIRLLAIVRTGGRYGERMASHAAALRAMARIRAGLFAAVAAMPAARSLQLHLGDLSARMIQDVGAIEARLVRLSAPWNALSGIATAIALILIGGWAPAVAAAGCMSLLLIAARHLASRIEILGRHAQVAAGALKDVVGTMTNAAPELRCYGLETWALDQISARSEGLADAQRDLARASAWYEMLQALATGTAAVAALLLSAKSGAPIAAMAALAAAMAVDCLSPLLRDVSARGMVREAEARLEAVLEGGAVRHGATPVTTHHGVELRFARQPCLLPGARVAITGASGAGKTTLVEQLLCLRPIAPGMVAIGGCDLATLSAADARRLFAWAPQNASLLAGTVRDNLLLACPDASEDELWSALHDAAIDTRIRALPGGIEGWIGEDGAGLSGGERRRLSLARAYLARAPWLLLDEPTEGLDRGTEDLVIDRLRDRLAAKGQGLILVSHRPATVALCDVPVAAPGARPPLAATNPSSLHPQTSRQAAWELVRE
jgi:ATP-binding cassette subfamily C protein CydC